MSHPAIIDRPVEDDILALQPAPTAQTPREQTFARLGRMPLEVSPLLAVLELRSDQAEQVVQVLNSSPMLATRVLALANCSAFKPRVAITSVKRAVLQLGARRARTVALAHAMRVICRNCVVPELLLNQLWANCVAKAAAARLFAEHTHTRHSDTAYTQALLQDVGLYALMAIDPAFYENRVFDTAGRVPWCDVEREHFGTDHVEVGVHILTSYRVDASLIESVRLHHQPPTSLDDPAAIERMPAFVAGLLPHLHEEAQPVQTNWLHGIFGNWLIEQYDTPEQFVARAYTVAAEIGAGEPATITRDRLIASLAEELTGDVLHLVAENGRLDESLQNQGAAVATLREEALSDGLTKLLNRRAFRKLADRRMALAQEQKLSMAIALIDLDGFKTLNDTYGHDAGDQMLRGLSKLLRRIIERRHLLARLGGDEFAVLMIGLSQEQTLEIAKTLDRAARGKKMRIQPQIEVPLRMSVGLLYAPLLQPHWQVEQMMEAADKLMYQRKRTGKAGVLMHRYDGSASISDRMVTA